MTDEAADRATARTSPENARTALRGTTEPLAGLHDVALLDLDGVVYVGPAAVPHAAESLHIALAEFGMHAAFVTNNASRPPAAVADHLVELGIRAAASDVVTSAQAGARLLRDLGVPTGSQVLAVGGPGVAEALRERGFVPVTKEGADLTAVIQGYGPDVGWRDLAEASVALGRGLPWVATNLDRTIPSPRGRVLGNGSMVAALRHATGAVPAVAGKPEEPLMLESIERTGAGRPLVVGDRLDTDIEGANRCSVPSLLVLTGVTDWHELIDAPVMLRPTYVDHDLRALLRPAPEVSVEITDGTLHARCRDSSLGVVVRAAAARDSLGRAWLPGPWRDHTDASGLSDGDLDVVRAVVGAAWVMADDGLAPVGQAVVSTGVQPAD